MLHVDQYQLSCIVWPPGSSRTPPFHWCSRSLACMTMHNLFPLIFMEPCMHDNASISIHIFASTRPHKLFILLHIVFRSNERALCWPSWGPRGVEVCVLSNRMLLTAAATTTKAAATTEWVSPKRTCGMSHTYLFAYCAVACPKKSIPKAKQIDNFPINENKHDVQWYILADRMLTATAAATTTTTAAAARAPATTTKNSCEEERWAFIV